MCLIVDTNVLKKVFGSPADPEFQPVQNSLLSPKKGKAARMALGGRVRREAVRLKSLLPLLAELERAGRLRFVQDSAVDALEGQLIAAGVVSSDDPHVIALGQLSGVRLLCSNDQGLHADWTNKDLLDKPRGRVYQLKSHARLLAEHCKGCG